MVDAKTARRRLERLRAQAAKEPNSAMTHVRLGTALLQARGTLREAEKEFRRAVELDPECTEAWVNLGGALFSQFDFAGCVEANRQAATCSPGLLLAHYNQGLGHMYLGQAEAMVACFRRVLEIDPEHPGANYHLAVGLLALEQVDEARVSLNRAVALGHSPRPELLRALEREERKSREAAASAAADGSTNHN